MAEQGEQAFVKSFLNILSSQPVTYPDDYQAPPQQSLKKVPVLPIDLPTPPKSRADSSTSSPTSISVTIKSTKPPTSFTLSVQLTDSISSIKSQLAAQPSAPSPDAQRLLLRGKALADGKLLKEYNVNDGDIINLMIKPGHNWDPSKPIAAMPPSPHLPSPFPTPSDSRPKLNIQSKHGRAPSIVLSPSPSNVSPSSENEKPLDIALTLDTSAIPTASSTTEALSTYHTTVAKPEFWEGLRDFLKSEFLSEDDALLAFEDFLRASKGTLTASEIAKIRDQVGVVGMAGM